MPTAEPTKKGVNQKNVKIPLIVTEKPLTTEVKPLKSALKKKPLKSILKNVSTLQATQNNQNNYEQSP